jgi:divalent metal cation (Fe/Co/Zn/Cd) transporter
MATVRSVALAIFMMGLLWFSLDSRLVTPEPAAPGTSAALIALGLLFGVGAWAFNAANRGERTPSLAGLSTGTILYGLLRLVIV